MLFRSETQRLVRVRRVQTLFRQSVLISYDGRCAVTGLAVTELLRASHIKPWASCASDAERLDVFNGLLLAPNLDAAFDRGFISIADNGDVLVSERLTADARRVLVLDLPLRVRQVAEGHRAYLRFHRERVLLGPASGIR